MIEDAHIEDNIEGVIRKPGKVQNGALKDLFQERGICLSGVPSSISEFPMRRGAIS